MRTYADRCGVARALDVVGERWALLVIRELVLGPKRFTDLRIGVPQVGPDMLSQRLRELEDAGLVRRKTLSPPAAARVYELTDRGAELEPVILALGRWGSRAPLPDADAPFGADSAVLAMKTLFSPTAAGGVSASFALRLGDHHFALRVAEDAFDVARGEAAAADTTIETTPAVLAQVLWHGRSSADAERAGEMTITGSRRASSRFLRSFPLPT